MLGCFRGINIQVEALCSGFEAELCMFGIDVDPQSTVTLCNRVFHGLFSGFYNGQVSTEAGDRGNKTLCAN